mmetsp:Transcript_90995/g.181491  ORF Transcript_90995/g.181491 Transcript_90995/m.181491 type:complete len:293 (+) Transcript_90995:561-1439(+)
MLSFVIIIGSLLGVIQPSSALTMSAAAKASAKNVVILGGTGYVGNTVAKLAVSRGHAVTSLSRRGSPAGGSALPGVTYLAGDATDQKVMDNALSGCDAVVHALGLLFDVSTPGGGALNLIVSASNSRPGPESTYDAITRQTAFNAIASVKRQQGLSIPFVAKKPVPFCFVSAAEAGWPDMSGGEFVEKNLAPAPLRRYLEAKRTVEAALESAATSGSLRPVVYRPSLIWDWSKLDVLPIIPVFNIASALGVPFVDKTIRVETLARAIVAGFEGSAVSGVQRVGEMEALSEEL